MNSSLPGWSPWVVTAGTDSKSFKALQATRSHLLSSALVVQNGHCCVLITKTGGGSYFADHWWEKKLTDWETVPSQKVSMMERKNAIHPTPRRWDLRWPEHVPPCSTVFCMKPNTLPNNEGMPLPLCHQKLVWKSCAQEAATANTAAGCRPNAGKGEPSRFRTQAAT